MLCVFLNFIGETQKCTNHKSRLRAGMPTHCISYTEEDSLLLCSILFLVVKSRCCNVLYHLSNESGRYKTFTEIMRRVYYDRLQDLHYYVVLHRVSKLVPCEHKHDYHSVIAVLWSRDSSVRIVTRLQATCPRTPVSIPGKCKELFSFPKYTKTGSGSHPASSAMCTGGRAAVELRRTTHLRVVQRLKVRGAAS